MTSSTYTQRLEVIDSLEFYRADLPDGAELTTMDKAELARRNPVANGMLNDARQAIGRGWHVDWTQQGTTSGRALWTAVMRDKSGKVLARMRDIDLGDGTDDPQSRPYSLVIFGALATTAITEATLS
jgi:hypothetical protein